MITGKTKEQLMKEILYDGVTTYSGVDYEDIPEFLQKANISVKIANNGKEAIEILENEEFDGVLMDCQMPILDGYEATRSIRKYEKVNNLKPIPIIALSAYAFKEENEKSIEAGCNEHITKPINKKMLISLVKKLMKEM